MRGKRLDAMYIIKNLSANVKRVISGKLDLRVSMMAMQDNMQILMLAMRSAYLQTSKVHQRKHPRIIAGRKARMNLGNGFLTVWIQKVSPGQYFIFLPSTTDESSFIKKHVYLKSISNSGKLSTSFFQLTALTMVGQKSKQYFWFL